MYVMYIHMSMGSARIGFKSHCTRIQHNHHGGIFLDTLIRVDHSLWFVTYSLYVREWERAMITCLHRINVRVLCTRCDVGVLYRCSILFVIWTRDMYINAHYNRALIIDWPFGAFNDLTCVWMVVYVYILFMIWPVSFSRKILRVLCICLHSLSHYVCGTLSYILNLHACYQNHPNVNVLFYTDTNEIFERYACAYIVHLTLR